MIKIIFFDFGGVIAEEGFSEGLKRIARKNSLDPEEFFSFANERIYTTGYVIGMAEESDYWGALREETAIEGTDEELREEILSGFILRDYMIDFVKELKDRGYKVAILSDQTDWLDILNNRTPFFHYFDAVFNSYYLHKGKRDPSLFLDVCKIVDVVPQEAVFIDDNPENIKRASSVGMNTVLYNNFKDMKEKIMAILSR